MATRCTWPAPRRSLRDAIGALNASFGGTCVLLNNGTTSHGLTKRCLSLTKPRLRNNRIYAPLSLPAPPIVVRNEEEFSNILRLSSSSGQPLLTLWTASWCSTCRAVAPLIRELVERDRVGESAEGNSVGYAEVELDAPDIAPVAGRYMISSVPMLLSFSRGEPQMDARVTDARKMSDRHFLTNWIQQEAARRGAGGAGGSMLGKLFGR